MNTSRSRCFMVINQTRTGALINDLYAHIHLPLPFEAQETLEAERNRTQCKTKPDAR